MKSSFVLAAFAAGTNALVGRSDSCCFHLTASGGVSGSLGQLGDGQVRIGDKSLSAAQFCIANGAITDSEGRGCVITSETTQFQCDQGATATSGFSVTSSGELEFQGSPNFIACETGENGGRNVYTTNSTSVTQCQSVQLTADSCSGSSSGVGSSSSMMASTAPASSEVASSTPVAIPTSAASSPAASSPGASSPVTPSPVTSSPVAPSPAASSPVAIPSSAASSPVAPGSETTSSEAPSASVPGGPESSAPVPASSGSPGPGTGSSASAPAPANSAPLSASPITVMTTVTVTDCSCESTGAPAPGGSSQPSVAPSGGTTPTGGAQPSGPAGGSQPSGSSVPVAPSSAATSPSGGSQSSSSVVVSSFSTAPASSPVGASSTASASGSCPTTLSGNYEYPHLIVPVNSSSPGTSYGTQYFGTVSSTVSTAFNFDIPSADSGKTCSLVFLFPKKADLETSDYTFSGDGKIDFAKLSSAVSQSTTYDNLPSVSQDLGEITISEGNSYVVSTFSCPAGQTVAYEMKSAGSTYLNFFEDYNPSPLGLYITVC